MRSQGYKMENTGASHKPNHLLTIVEPEKQTEKVFYGKTQFQHILHIERIRAERSQKPLLLMLLDVSSVLSEGRKKEASELISGALCLALREADIRGWYHHNKTMGVIFTEISAIDSHSIEAIIRKIHRNLQDQLNSDLINKIHIFFHIFPKM